MKLTLLGTSCMVPTKSRNVSGMYLDFNGTGVLFDCGEGTQRQMNIADLNRNKISIICLSHWHADHVAGLIGLLQTVNTKELVKKLVIIGPVETKRRLQHLIDATYCDMSIEMEIIEVAPSSQLETVYDQELFCIQATSLDHGIPCVGYVFVEKERHKILVKKLTEDNIPAGRHLAKLQAGEDSVYQKKKLLVSEYTSLVPAKRFAYIADTKVCSGAPLLAQSADLVVCESTYVAEQKLTATKHNHLTSEQAATIALNAGAKKLILTHISQRYAKTRVLLAEAQAIFPNTVVGEDFMIEKF